ncbi:hypothetical protein [Guptibacillus hwajinpoensis]|uniref:DNA-directed RNA polymerase subunit RPC12/RpoP n=1 Tax=Guptibacillus hwajinpoensis TaxID=208199 RepID=A0ABU0K5S0_9BACL|nr:hypothetical protein [Alkalihalobacillus hemicentroti]MDQ0484693.1 DNA-directed RNA polymerase subunit RPC12/RpoP [Alkalihalobacillus hemicentroti]
MKLLLLQMYYNRREGLVGMTQGKERIRFDCVGTLEEPHVYKCSECDHEFRGLIGGNENRDYELDCPQCDVTERITTQPQQFEVVGVIENAV